MRFMNQPAPHHKEKHKQAPRDTRQAWRRRRQTRMDEERRRIKQTSKRDY